MSYFASEFDFAGHSMDLSAILEWKVIPVVQSSSPVHWI